VFKIKCNCKICTLQPKLWFRLLCYYFFFFVIIIVVVVLLLLLLLMLLCYCIVVIMYIIIVIIIIIVFYCHFDCYLSLIDQPRNLFKHTQSTFGRNKIDKETTKLLCYFKLDLFISFQICFLENFTHKSWGKQSKQPKKEEEEEERKFKKSEE